MSDEIRWARGPEFAEIAEALEITTTMIAGMQVEKGSYLVMYTPDYPEDDTLWSVALRRGSDGILVKNSLPTPHRDLTERLKARLDELAESEDD